MSSRMKMKALLFILIVSLTTICIPLSGYAKEDAFQFAQDASLQAGLLQFKGKPVEIILKSGDQLAGKISDVGSRILVLKELRGKEFYDAVVVIDDISAVIFKAR
jgi:hypothetical protein